MRVLGFERACEIVAGRRVRPARFGQRSALPLSAACLVANGVRELLTSIFCTPVSLRLIEPVIPDPAAWRVISSDAQFFAVRGAPAEAAFVLRANDALTLAAAAFAEPASGPRALSAVETEVLMRALKALSGALAPLCGAPAPLERILDIAGFTTYFELLVERPASFRIGVALSREPAVPAGTTLQLRDLLDVEIEAGVCFAAGAIPAPAVLDLGPGVLVPMMTKVGERGVLVMDGIVLARGECGAMGERHAMIVSAAA